MPAERPDSAQYLAAGGGSNAPRPPYTSPPPPPPPADPARAPPPRRPPPPPGGNPRPPPRHEPLRQILVEPPDGDRVALSHARGPAPARRGSSPRRARVPGGGACDPCGRASSAGSRD